jgi:hypothetical protein
MTGAVLGIDIGVRGAIALLDEFGKLTEIADMPCLADGPAGRRTVNAPLLAEIVARSRASRAFVELVGVPPGRDAVLIAAAGLKLEASHG